MGLASMIRDPVIPLLYISLLPTHLLHFSCIVCRKDRQALQVMNDGVNTLFDAEFVRPDVDLGLQRWLVRCGDACEVFDLASSGLLVEALWIPLLEDGQWRIDEDLDERKLSLLMDRSGVVAVGSVR